MSSKNAYILFKKQGANTAPANAMEALEVQENFLKQHLEKLKLIEIKLSELDQLASKKTK